MNLEAVLGRSEHDVDLDALAGEYAGQRVLITGAKGSLGSELAPLLTGRCGWLEAHDIDTLDVLDGRDVWRVCDTLHPDVIFHLAAGKHAPDGEIEPYSLSRLNIEGTQNVLRIARLHNARVVLASTCKAIEPETVYGASKLIAERLVLNYRNGAVARFFNIPETQGNVFRLWESIPETDRIHVTTCLRYFISQREALGLLLAAGKLEPGRYIVDPGPPRHMRDVARDLYPTREREVIPPRRGDRMAEPYKGDHERDFPTGLRWIRHIVNAHDKDA